MKDSVRYIDQPGIYQMSAEDYHSLQLPQPALSASIIKVLLQQSPKHAWTLHPALNPNYARQNKQMFDDGEGSHALFLEGKDNIAVIDVNSLRRKEAEEENEKLVAKGKEPKPIKDFDQNYLSNVAKEERDAAYAAGLTPMLLPDYEDALNMVNEAHKQLAECEDLIGYTLADGKSEQTLVCQLNGVWCKARLDHHENDFTFILDYKTSSASAEPRAATRRILDQMGGDIQAAFYRAMVQEVTGKFSAFYFMSQENTPPYACSIIRATPGYMDIGASKIGVALSLWKKCLESNNWPGYSARAFEPELKPWFERDWLEKLSEGSEYAK